MLAASQNLGRLVTGLLVAMIICNIDRIIDPDIGPLLASAHEFQEAKVPRLVYVAPTGAIHSLYDQGCRTRGIKAHGPVPADDGIALQVQNRYICLYLKLLL